MSGVLTIDANKLGPARSPLIVLAVHIKVCDTYDSGCPLLSPMYSPDVYHAHSLQPRRCRDLFLCEILEKLKLGQRV
jgi:hypothetical protein